MPAKLRVRILAQPGKGSILGEQNDPAILISDIDQILVSAHEVADYQLVDSQGATEGTVANLTAEAIADITSSGETLRANNLKIIAGDPILRSQATLFANRAAMGADMAAFLRQLGLPDQP